MMGIPRSAWGNQAQWGVTAPLLAASIAGSDWALPLALMLCAATLVWQLAKLRTVRAYPVQIRLGFMGVAGLGGLSGLEWILWIPLAGTFTQTLFGYCPMARFLDLMPWNRSEGLSVARVWGVVTRRPGDEGLLSIVWRPAREAAAVTVPVTAGSEGRPLCRG